MTNSCSLATLTAYGCIKEFLQKKILTADAYKMLWLKIMSLQVFIPVTTFNAIEIFLNSHIEPNIEQANAGDIAREKKAFDEFAEKTLLPYFVA
jgi:hypothetical protein